MMRGRLLVIGLAAATAPNHRGAVLSLSQAGEWEAEPGARRYNTSWLEVEPDTPVNPDCGSCTGVDEHGNPSPNGCCYPKRPSQLKTPRCSPNIPQSWHMAADHVTVDVWNSWVTHRCEIPTDCGKTDCGKVGIVPVGNSLCDPCRTSGMISRGGEKDGNKWLYCENADNRKDYLTCFPATRPTYQLKCNPVAANDAFGGWELQTTGDDGKANIPECNAAAKEWEVAFHDEGGAESYNGTHTWPPDQEMACSESGSKDLTGTDACHDDWCVYEGGAVTYGTDAEPRWPFNDFESCAKEIEDKGMEKACSEKKADGSGFTGRVLDFRKGCRKSCGLCRPSIKESAAPQETPRARDDITNFKTCNKIMRNLGVPACKGGQTGTGCTNKAGDSLPILTNMIGTEDTCDSFNSKSDSGAMGQCARHYHYNETEDEGYICYKKLETDPETSESRWICTQGPEYKCKWGDWADGEVKEYVARGNKWEISEESGETSGLLQTRAKSRADHIREAAAGALRALEAGSARALAEVETVAEAAYHAVSVSAAGVLGEATTTAAPDGPHVPYFKTRELARAAKRSVLEKEQRAKSLLEATSRAGTLRAHWRGDTYFNCDVGGNKDTNGTDFCHDDFCVYEGGTKSSARKPYEDFVSCAFEAKQGACTKHGLSHFMEDGCRKTCGHCKATQLEPEAGHGYDIDEG